MKRLTFFCCLILCSFSVSAERTILVLGDSLSAAHNIPAEKGWVNLLSLRLGDEFQVINASISGETSAGGRQRFSQLASRHQPDYLILELGANDGLRGVSPRTLLDNLNWIADQAQKQGARILILGIEIPVNYGAGYRSAFRKVFAMVAESHGAPIVPFFMDTVIEKGGLLQADGLHPNSEAQPLILERVWPDIAAFLGVPVDSGADPQP